MVHLQENGFTVETRDVSDEDLAQMKLEAGIAPQHSGCHTAVVDGYFVEGHVPAEQVQRLLAERPDVRGLAVPGMPLGSPGMEGATSEPYDVLAIDAQGNTTVYASY